MQWKPIFNNDTFTVDYCNETGELRISYFEDYHFKNDVIIRLPLGCFDCSYFNGKCTHPNGVYCCNGELWWPKDKNS